jgi:hypothetical protein
VSSRERAAWIVTIVALVVAGVAVTLLVVRDGENPEPARITVKRVVDCGAYSTENANCADRSMRALQTACARRVKCRLSKSPSSSQRGRQGLALVDDNQLTPSL